MPPARFPLIAAVAMLSVLAGCGGQSADELAGQSGEKTERDLVEVDLGEFFVTQRYRSAEGYGLAYVRFHLFGLIPKDKSEEVQQLLQERQQRMRDRVIAEVQSAELERLVEPSLTWIRQSLLATVQESLKTRHVADVVLSAYDLYTESFDWPSRTAESDGRSHEKQLPHPDSAPSQAG